MLTLVSKSHYQQAQQQLQQEAQQHAEALRDLQKTHQLILQALEHSTSNIMIADANFNIIYLNAAVKAFLSEAEADIRKELPNFSVANLQGANIDIFHKNPAHQRNMLAQLTTPYQTSIMVGGRSFNLNALPIFDASGQKIGVSVEWQDGAAKGIMDALSRSQAMIEFALDGTILHANENFLRAMGYSLSDIVGRHHSMFVSSDYRNSSEYRDFWPSLARGEFKQGEFCRYGKDQKEIWIQASYNPILDRKGKPVKVVKTASDITDMVRIRTENERGVKEAMTVLGAMSEGNLQLRMEEQYHGAFADIKQAVNRTLDTLVETVMQIKQAAESVNVAASEISAGTADLSIRTEEQASSLEETAASMEQMTGAVKQNSDNANHGRELATQASDVAEKGGQVVHQAVQAMSGIERASQKIADIISVIDEIAFQTNLLALNAAVEAARAGEAGKGFAVVAQEVRSLAGRSASASKEIKALIQDSVGQVKDGAELVNRTGTSLNDIVEAIRKVNGIMNDIANASIEQSSGINEINTAIAQMDEVTQQNAALVEENSAAAQALVDQANQLERLMRFFQVDDSQAQALPSLPLASAKKTTAKEKKPRPAAGRATPILLPGATKGNGHAKADGNYGAGDGWESF